MVLKLREMFCSVLEFMEEKQTFVKVEDIIWTLSFASKYARATRTCFRKLFQMEWKCLLNCQCIIKLDVSA
jgi:hypothetical protein